jgi:hypothetical protein
MPSDRAAELGTMVAEGIAEDVFVAERAYQLLKTIGSHAAEINANDLNFGQLFGTIQDLCKTTAVLATARVFDRRNSRYETHRVGAVLDFIEVHRAELPIVEKGRVVELARKASGDLSNSAPDVELTTRLVAHFREQLDRSDVVDAIERLREMRDKVVAHNERVAGVQGPTWNAVVSLLALAKHLIGAVGWGYLARVYVRDDGSFRPDTDAQRPAAAMMRLLQELRILKREEPPRFD